MRAEWKKTKFSESFCLIVKKKLIDFLTHELHEHLRMSMLDIQKSCLVQKPQSFIKKLFASELNLFSL